MILQTIAQQLQDFYRLDPLPPIEQFLITGSTAANALGLRSAQDLQADELLLLRQERDAVELGLYLAPSVLDQLQHDNPLQCFHDGNLAAFCTAVEGVSHWACIWWKHWNEMPVTQLELEIQAEIDKFLCCMWLQQTQGHPLQTTVWQRLFDQYRVIDGIDPVQTHRYHLASRMASQFCDKLVASRPLLSLRWHTIQQLMRKFYRLSHWAKLRALSNRPIAAT